MICPICSNPQSTKFDEDKFRAYFLCSECSLIYVPRDKILSFDAEAARYEAHQNDVQDQNYRDYLNQTAEAIIKVINKNESGLDFGCGRTTLLANIFKNHGIAMESYDLYFHPKQDFWENKFDFIVLSEVIEHLSDPLGVMKKLKAILKPKGRFFIKTKFYPPDSRAFSTWFYKRDQTHVQFFNYESMSKLAELLKMKGPEKLPAPDLYGLKF